MCVCETEREGEFVRERQSKSVCERESEKVCLREKEAAGVHTLNLRFMPC